MSRWLTYKRGRAGCEAVPPVVCSHPFVSVARIAFGLSSLMARSRVTSYERVIPNRNLTQHNLVLILGEMEMVRKTSDTLSQGSGSGLFENSAAVEVALVVEMVIEKWTPDLGHCLK